MKVRVLVVDETAFVRDALKRSLRRFLRDVEIFDANSGLRAQSLLRTNKIDLVIGDWEMKELPAHEFLAGLRESEQYKGTPVIIMVEALDRNVVTAAANAGASDFLPKPFSPDDVQKRVVKQLAKIGMLPKNLPGAAASSLDLLTGSAGASKPQMLRPREIRDVADFAKPSGAKANAAARTSAGFSGSAQLLFEHFSTVCEVKELSLTTLGGIIQRAAPEQLPRVFDNASASIINARGELVAELRVFVYAVQALEPHADADRLRIQLRFGDNDAAQLEQLSKAIAQG